MHRRIKIFPYKQGSRSAKALANAIKGRVLKHVNSIFNPRSSDVVINWGSSFIPPFDPATVLNRDITNAQCKRKSFKLFAEHDVPAPSFWLYKVEIPDDAYPVMCRTILNGHSGAGIVIAENADELVDAHLYTKYIKKQDEYRVHVFKETAFFIQRKARKLDVPDPDWRVRNLAGGFVFIVADGCDVPEPVITASLAAIKALGLDFGGVDVLWNNHNNQAYVIEVNTACGLEERTAERYAETIGEHYGLS